MSCSFDEPMAGRGSWARVTLIGLSSAAALFVVVLLAYQLALARVPQHRATLERLLQSQTGLDVRFSQLGVRWGWYGPEAVFRNVSLGEPGRPQALLRAPELTIGFDAWRTMRSGHLEAGRISLIAPDIDLQRVGTEPRPGTGQLVSAKPRVGIQQRLFAESRAGTQLVGGLPPSGARAPTGLSSAAALERVRLLQRWRDGLIDIEGGTLRLPDPSGSADPLVLQIRRASVRRSGDDWNIFALVFLPERLGRTARVVMRLEGGLDQPQTWSGSLRFEGSRLAFAGWRDLGGLPSELARYVPVAGGGDVNLDVDFARGRIDRAAGSLHTGGVVLGAWSPESDRRLGLDRLRGRWWLTRRSSYWQLRVEDLQIGSDEVSASDRCVLTAEIGDAWTRGKLESAPLQAVAALGLWLAPDLDLGGAQLGGTARELSFNWDEHRAPGSRLNASAKLADVSLAAPRGGFVLTGMAARVTGNEDELEAGLQADNAALQLAGAPQHPLEGVRVLSRLRITHLATGWRIATERLELRHERTKLEIAGSLSGAGSNSEPELTARGKLTGADVPLLQAVLGAGVARVLGNVALSGGRVERADFDVRGPLDELPYAHGEGSFTGALTLQDASIAGDERWPDATGIDARVEWRGSLVHAQLDAGQAGPFQLANATAEWRSSGEGDARLSGQVTTRIEEATAWLQSHPRLDEYASRVQSIGMQGDARVDFDITVPPAGGSNAGVRPPYLPQARFVAHLEGAQLSWASGGVPIENLTGALAFDAGRLQRSTLSGTWLGGPVTLRVDERREHGQASLAMQAHGSMAAQQLAALAAIDARGRIAGVADWSGELTFSSAAGVQPARWRVRADSTLVGVASDLPEPLDKDAAGPLPVHLELSGTDSAAQLRVSLADRLRSVLALQRGATGWTVERGAVTFGAGAPVLPADAVVLLQGRVERLDLPSYLALWQQARLDPRAPHFQAQLIAGKMVAAGRSYPEVLLAGERTDSGVELKIDSESLAGVAHWPPVGSADSAAAELHLTRLSVPQPAEQGSLGAVLGALGSTARISVDDLTWGGRHIGHVTATLVAHEGLDLDNVRISGSTHDGTASLRCQPSLTSCRAVFTLESSDAAATLADFGFRPDVSAASAVVSGDLRWQPDPGRAWPATLAGRLSVKLADGETQTDALRQAGTPFALLSVPALIEAMKGLRDDRAPARDLRFTQLQADFELADGEASTSDLHFDGDAEILMRGRTGLLARDYDQEVWVLKGEERLPAAVRRLAPSPRVAAAWLTLRDLFAATGEARPRALLHLQGSWDDPLVVSDAE
jgi:uncharacterized protein YhdP